MAQKEIMARPDLRNMKVKKGDLVLLVYDNPQLSKGALVIGEFSEFCPLENSFSDFRAYPGLTITQPKTLCLAVGPTDLPEETLIVKLPQVQLGNCSTKYLTSAERIYIGTKNVRKALRKDPVAKSLLPYLDSLDLIE